MHLKKRMRQFNPHILPIDTLENKTNISNESCVALIDHVHDFDFGRQTDMT